MGTAASALVYLEATATKFVDKIRSALGKPDAYLVKFRRHAEDQVDSMIVRRKSKIKKLAQKGTIVSITPIHELKGKNP